jgi:hypothetical protein
VVAYGSPLAHCLHCMFIGIYGDAENQHMSG